MDNNLVQYLIYYSLVNSTVRIRDYDNNIIINYSRRDSFFFYSVFRSGKRENAMSVAKTQPPSIG